MAANDIFTLASLADQVSLNVGSQDNITELKAQKWINRALLRFQELGEWSWQRVYEQPFPNAAAPVLVANQKVYTVSNCLRIESIFLRSPIQRRLVMLEDRQYRRMYPNDTATGTPYYYRLPGRTNVDNQHLNSRNVGFYPIPDSGYTVLWDGVAPINYLLNTTDDIRVLTGMPDFLVDLVIEMATAIGWKEIDDADGQAQMAEVLKRLKGAYSDDQNEIDSRLIMAPFESEDIDRYFDPQLNPNFNE